MSKSFWTMTMMMLNKLQPKGMLSNLLKKFDIENTNVRFIDVFLITYEMLWLEYTHLQMVNALTHLSLSLSTHFFSIFFFFSSLVVRLHAVISSDLINFNN